ncbi:hypothetical protein [Agrobacterium rosae]|uniref:hypothetical protein n=1 Tax=Agrobacterium rosae TaxID=1972867 RepID=UPI003A8102C7
MLEVLRNTPHWVYTVFTVTLYFGLSSCFEGRIGNRYLLITPALFVLISIVTVVNGNGANVHALSNWTFGVLAALGLTYWLTLATGSGLRREGEDMIIPGGASVLLVGLGAFAVKYWFGYSSAIGADWTMRASFSVWDSFTSGLIVGFFGGRGLAHFTIFRRLASISDLEMNHAHR